jgi:hypothetical protein
MELACTKGQFWRSKIDQPDSDQACQMIEAARIHQRKTEGDDMTAQTERQRLSSRFDDMKNTKGLLDMKFQLGKVSETTTEAVCAEVNRMLDSYEKGMGFQLARETNHS